MLNNALAVGVAGAVVVVTATILGAVELLWKEKKIEVASVQIVNVHGKKKRFGAFTGRRRNWKKAYVSLKPGQEVNFAQEA